MRRPTTALIVLLGSLTASCAQKSLAPTSFSPLYKSQLDASDVAIVRNCAVVSAVDVTNGLKGRVVGKRTLESGAVPAQSISVEGDLATWVRSSAKEMFQRASLKTSVVNAPQVKLRLSELQVNENVRVNAGYDARVIMDVSVVNTRGEACWTARKTGYAQNWGKHGSAEAYRETVDHALDRAVMSIAADASFQDALCSSCKK